MSHVHCHQCPRTASHTLCWNQPRRQHGFTRQRRYLFSSHSETYLTRQTTQYRSICAGNAMSWSSRASSFSALSFLHESPHPLRLVCVSLYSVNCHSSLFNMTHPVGDIKSKIYVFNTFPLISAGSGSVFIYENTAPPPHTHTHILHKLLLLLNF